MENTPAPSEEASNVETTLRYKQLFEDAVDGILILSYPDGEIKDLNPAAIQLLGYARNELIGTCFWESTLIHPNSAGYDMYARLLKYRKSNYPELLLITKSGSTIPIHFSAEVYRLDHKSIIQCNLHNAMEVHGLKKIIHNHAISSQ